MQALMEVCRGMPKNGLDLILHSPGGSAEATARLVDYLRQQFTHIRIFVPLAAMSAATMWCFAADELVMGKHSQLGPIDPQMVTSTGMFPSRAIKTQFETALKDCSSHPNHVAAWLPILAQYGPALLAQCDTAEALSKQLAMEWLEKYFFKGDVKAKDKAKLITEYFADANQHFSHAKGIDIDEAKQAGLDRITALENDQQLQDAVLSVHHAALHSFMNPVVIKIVENHQGHAFVRLGQQIMMPMIPPIQVPVPQAPPAAPAP
ncbi:MAG: SDH family Clp fold serine proteinase, partial [Gammaproteobacteria bacterium]